MAILIYYMFCRYHLLTPKVVCNAGLSVLRFVIRPYTVIVKLNHTSLQTYILPS